MAVPVALIATVAVGVLAVGLALFAIFDTPTSPVSYDNRRRRPSPPRRPPSPPRYAPPTRRRRRSPPPPSNRSLPPTDPSPTPLDTLSVRGRQISRSPGNDPLPPRGHREYSHRPNRVLRNTSGSPVQHLSTSPPRIPSPPPVSTNQEHSLGTSTTNSVVAVQRPVSVGSTNSLPILDSEKSHPGAVALSSASPGEDMALNSPSQILDSVAPKSELPTDTQTTNSALAGDDVASISTTPFLGSSNLDPVTPSSTLQTSDSAASGVSDSDVGVAKSSLPGVDVASTSDNTSSSSALAIQDPALPTDALAPISTVPIDDMALIPAFPRPGSAASTTSVSLSDWSVTSGPACHRSDLCENCDDIINDIITFVPCGGAYFCRKCGLKYLSSGKFCCKCGKVITSSSF